MRCSELINSRYGGCSHGNPGRCQPPEDVSPMFDQDCPLQKDRVLINTAGLNIDKPFLEITDKDWSTVLGTILTGTFICSQEFARRYQGEAGHIITIGAVTALRGRKNGANYCSARAGVLTLTKCMALELAPRIRVNCVTPGYINTEEVMERYKLDEQENLERALSGIPMSRLGKTEDVFQIVDFLVNTTSYVTGQNYFVDGGSYMHKTRMSKPVLGLLSGLTAAAIWGGMYVVSKVVMQVIPPFSLIVMRLALGILTLGIIVIVRKGWKVTPGSSGASLAWDWWGMAFPWVSNLSARNFPQRPTARWSPRQRLPLSCCSPPCCWPKRSPAGACWPW